MKKYIQTTGEIDPSFRLPLHRKFAVLDLIYVGYGVLIVALVLVSYLLGLFKLLPNDPDQNNMALLMAPPGTPGYMLGTDFMGRDILSRLILGIQAYFLPGILAISISLIGGIVLGVLAGYRGGHAETAITYFTNLVDSFPRLVLILLVIAAFKPDIYYIMMVMGITGVPAVASAIAGKIRLLAQKNFIEAAIALGLRRRAIILKHILWYNCRAILIIQATLGMGEAILLETSLSYLGFGVQEPTPSWGNMVQSGANYLMQGNFWLSTAPAMAILFTILGFNLLGDGLNNMLEGKTESVMPEALLKIENLRTYFYARSKQAFVRSVDGVSLEVGQRETVGVVGESGSGKSITAMSVLGLINGGPGVIGGSIRYASAKVQRDLLEGLDRFVQLEESGGRVMSVRKDERGWQKASERLMAGMRGKEIAMIFQNPRASLNPFITVGKQITEAVRLHSGITAIKEARERAIHWLERVKIDSPRLRFDAYPAGMSGGMCQRAMIAMALSSEPSLLIADEPTTGLDATIQSKIVDLLEELKVQTGISTLLISHDISVITRLSDRVAVLYGGAVVEYGPARQLLDARAGAKHPYTAALLASVPSEQKIRERANLQAIEGEVPDTINVPPGCRFYARCNQITPEIRDRCASIQPELKDVAPGHQIRCWRYAN